MTDELPGVCWQEQDGLHIDVRGLEPPEPMIAILGHIEKPGQIRPVTFHHDREPVFLYSELAERGWNHRIVPAEPGEVRPVLTLNR